MSEDTGFHVNGLLAAQMRNYAGYNAQRLREAKRDIKKGRVDEVVYTTLDMAIEALAAFAKIGKVNE
jgi:hypothetical protein